LQKEGLNVPIFRATPGSAPALFQQHNVRHNAPHHPTL
jgi:hypothetical protein